MCGQRVGRLSEEGELCGFRQVLVVGRDAGGGLRLGGVAVERGTAEQGAAEGPALAAVAERDGHGASHEQVVGASAECGKHIFD